MAIFCSSFLRFCFILWLISSAGFNSYFYCSSNGVVKYRKRLFQMINDLPTIFEVVTGAVKKQPKDKSSVTPNSSNKNKSSGKMQAKSETKSSKMAPPKEEEESAEEEEDEEQGMTLCGACGENYANDEFWICCDNCEKWFHGTCVKITPAKAEHIKQYKCPACSNKRARV